MPRPSNNTALSQNTYLGPGPLSSSTPTSYHDNDRYALLSHADLAQDVCQCSAVQCRQFITVSACTALTAKNNTKTYMQLVGKVASQRVQLPSLLLGFVQVRLEEEHLSPAGVHNLQGHTCQPNRSRHIRHQ